MAPRPAGMTIHAVYPTRHGGRATACDRERGLIGQPVDADVDVDFTVRVPDGVRFVAQQVNGGIDAGGLSGDIRAETVNGNVHVATRGLAEASTVNGSITPTIGRGSWDKDLHFQT